MHFVTAENESGRFVALENKDGTHLLPLRDTEKLIFGSSETPETLLACIQLGQPFIERVQNLLELAEEKHYISKSRVKLLAPIPRPEKNVFCVGKNYADHAIEMGSAEDIPENIMVFTKAPTTIIASNESIMSHEEITSELDYEGELAVIIGKGGRGIPKEEALNHVFGYSIINDITARDLQAKHKQFFIGKSLDTSCPFGPRIVYKDEIPKPNELGIKTLVNGEIRQDSNTRNFIFPIEVIIAELSKGMTLEPGDIIATGTPAGVGKGFKPPRFLKKGDTIEVIIQGIGSLMNTVE